MRMARRLQATGLKGPTLCRLTWRGPRPKRNGPSRRRHPKLPPMDANASPSFEVATIKPSKPDDQGKAFIVRGRHFQTINTSLSEIISFAYGVHAKQVLGAPALGADR